LKSSELLRKEYIYPKVLYDVVQRRNRMLWYLISILYCLEFEDVWKEFDNK